MLRNMKISERLILGFGLLTLLLILMIITGIRSERRISKIISHDILENNLRKEYANEMLDNVRDVSLALWTIVTASDNSQIEEHRKKIADNRLSYDESFSKYRELISENESEVLRQIEKVTTAQNTAREINNRVIREVIDGKYKNTDNELNNLANPRVSEWLSAVEELLDFEKTNSGKISSSSLEILKQVQTKYIIIGIFSLVLAIIIPLFIALSLTKPVDFMIDLITTRDTSKDISGYSSGRYEMNLMIQSFHRELNETIQKEEEVKKYRDQLEVLVDQRTADLSKVIGEVKETVNVLVSSSEQILAATSQVASGTAQTATAINETTTTVEEVLQASRLSAMKAKNVADSAQSVAKVSREGKESVEATIVAINQIKEQMDSIAQTVVRLSEQSQSIGGIIASVTDIADQSNLLAVNAAIEAAKAGEHGRGFAVVAQEIKNMAGQSKQATMQVRNILNDIQKATGAAVMATEQGSKAVEAGVKLSVRSGESIRVLAESTNEAVQAATQIVASSQQQVVGMDQISTAMQNINQAGTEAAVSMTQTEKSARNLNDTGLKLKMVVESIKA